MKLETLKKVAAERNVKGGAGYAAGGAALGAGVAAGGVAGANKIYGKGVEKGVAAAESAALRTHEVSKAVHLGYIPRFFTNPSAPGVNDVFNSTKGHMAGTAEAVDAARAAGKSVSKKLLGAPGLRKALGAGGAIGAALGGAAYLETHEKKASEENNKYLEKIASMWDFSGGVGDYGHSNGGAPGVAAAGEHPTQTVARARQNVSNAGAGANAHERAKSIAQSQRSSGQFQRVSNVAPGESMLHHGFDFNAGGFDANSGVAIQKPAINPRQLPVVVAPQAAPAAAAHIAPAAAHVAPAAATHAAEGAAGAAAKGGSRIGQMVSRIGGKKLAAGGAVATGLLALGTMNRGHNKAAALREALRDK